MEILGNGGGDMKKKIIEIVEKRGFILFLFICVCLVAGGTLYLSMKSLNTARDNTNKDEILQEEVRESSTQDDYLDFGIESDIGLGFYNSEDDEPLEDQDQDLDKDEREEVEELKEETVEEISEDVDLEESVQVSKVEPEVEEAEVEEPEGKEDADFVEEVVASFMPVDGEEITKYTKDVLVYSETLESWVGHGGIDIKAEEGSVVKSILPGRVKEVYEDKLWGIVIVIDHGNGLESKYANLQTDQMVEKDIKVERGDHIAKVGKTAKIEMHLEPHLHFEVRKDGKLIDPRSIID